MAGRIEARLAELGIELPEAREPRAARIKGANIAGNILYVSGQVPQWNGELKFIGKVGDAFTVGQGREAAWRSAPNPFSRSRGRRPGCPGRCRCFPPNKSAPQGGADFPVT